MRRRRTTMCGGAVVLAIGAGLVAAPGAGATTPTYGLPAAPGALSGTLSTVASGVVSTPAAAVSSVAGSVTAPLVPAVSGSPATVALPVVVPVVVPTSSTPAGVVAPVLAPIVAPTTAPVVGGVITTQTGPGSVPTSVSLVNVPAGSLATATLGGGTGAGGVAGEVVDVLTGGGTSGGGTSTGGTSTGGTSTGGGGVVSVDLGGVPTTSPSVPSVPALPASTPVTGPVAGGSNGGITVNVGGAAPVAVPAAPAASTPGSAAGSGGTGGSGGSGATVNIGGGTGTVPSTSVTTAPGAPATAADGDAATAVAHVLSLDVSRSVTTVYPVKDGYRDDAVFRLAAATSTGKPVPVDGTAVLRRGTRVVKTWPLSRSTQDLHWNGRDGSKVVPGSYTLKAVMRDADGEVFSTTTKVAASKKKLVAATKRLNAGAISGTHAMAAAPRAGLSKGPVTFRLTTVASKVKGAQSIVYERGGKRIVIPIRAGTHTSKAITIPKSFSRFTVRHTWKKGQVVLKSIRATYSYQTLR